MKERRRLLLLAVIIVAVAIGAAGIVLGSLFGAGLQQQRQLIDAHLADVAVVNGTVGRDAARLISVTDGWQVEAGVLPPAIVPTLPERKFTGKLFWQVNEGDSYLAGMRTLADGSAVVAWASLNEFYEAFWWATLQAVVALLLLGGMGVLLFYRMGMPLLQTIEGSEARYRTLFESTTEGVLLIGAGIDECNDRLCELFHCRREKILGLSWQHFFRRYAGGDEELGRFKAYVRLGLAGGRAPFNWTFNPVGRGALITEVTFRPVREGDNSLMLVSIRDVTAREESARVLRMAEQALRESRDRLVQAGKQSALIELASGIAHEVNQPLAAIASYAQASQRLLCAGKPCPDEVLVALDRIAAQAQRAGEAIHRIHALVPTAIGNVAARTCINRLIVEVIEMMGEEVNQFGSEVVLDLGEVEQPVRADPLQIQQVVMQLLRNALEAMAGLPVTKRQVCISTRLKAGIVEVAITDQGHGIEPDDRPNLFTPFFSTKEQGMGMGLAISLSIIQSYHGELDVDDQHAAGARFVFRLPADASAPWSDALCREMTAP